MSINGLLAGLVAITAPCAFVTVNAALIIGVLSGWLVVFAVKLLDKLQLDDPVGAVPVHLFNGVFGTIGLIDGPMGQIRRRTGTLWCC